MESFQKGPITGVKQNVFYNRFHMFIAVFSCFVFSSMVSPAAMEATLKNQEGRECQGHVSPGDP